MTDSIAPDDTSHPLPHDSRRRSSVAQRLSTAGVHPPARVSIAPTLDVHGLPEGERRHSVVFFEDTVKTEASNLTLRQSLLPVAMVTVLFFLWGFAYGLLDVLNKHFQETLGITRTKSAGLQGAYFGAYLLAPLTFGGYILRRWGYKVTFMTGLVIYGVGALMYWPSGVYKSFGGFCGATFIVGCGLSTLETAANPYIAICGPPKYAEIRLNISQGVQATGSVIAPIVAAYAFFNVKTDDLSTVQYVYIAIAAFVFLLAVCFYFAPIPEISDADMESQAEETGFYDNRPLWKQRNLIYGVFAQFCYVGAQVAVATFFINYVVEEAGATSQRGAHYLSIATACFAVGRFVAAFAAKFVRPRFVLLAFLILLVIFSGVAMGVKGDAAVAIITLVLFSESCIFPLIFTTAIKGLGKHTKRGASWIVASICGGALFPSLMGAASDSKNSTRFGFVVPLVTFTVPLSYAIYVNLFERTRLDTFGESDVGTKKDPQVDPVKRRSMSLSAEAQARRPSLVKPNAFHIEDEKV